MEKGLGEDDGSWVDGVSALEDRAWIRVRWRRGVGGDGSLAMETEGLDKGFAGGACIYMWRDE